MGMRFYRACTKPSLHTWSVFGSRALGLAGSKLGTLQIAPTDLRYRNWASDVLYDTKIEEWS